MHLGIFVAMILAVTVEAAFRRQKDESSMNTPELIKHRGYAVEEHTATTADGYILQMYRIPHGRSGVKSVGKPSTTMDFLGGIFGRQRPSDSKNPIAKHSRPVIFLQHGLQDSSDSFVVNPPELAPGFVFADAGFDVWLGNMRGNAYSRRHKSFIKDIPLSKSFWNFTFAEMATHDLQAMVDKALERSGQKSLYYVGHSQGTLTMFCKLARDQAFGKKIRKFFALAPVGTVKHIQGLIKILGDGKIGYPIVKGTYDVVGDLEFVPTTPWLAKVLGPLCKGRYVLQPMCHNVMTLIVGTGSKQIDSKRLPHYLGHVPSGTSYKNIMHWAQMVRQGELRDFDYGKEGNMRAYGQPQAPAYDLSKIAVETHLYWGPADWLAGQRDIEEFLIPSYNTRYLMENNKLADFNHIDFMWGQNAAAKVYKPIIETIRQTHK